MGRITSLFVHKIIRQVDDRLDKDALLLSLGIEPNAPVDPSLMVGDGDYYAWLERIAESDPHVRDLPLRTGASMRCDEYGALGLAMKSALTPRGTFERAERYAQVLTNVSSYEVRSTTEGAYVLLHRDGERRLGLRLSNEATIASLTSIGRQVSTRPFHPLAVFFKHPAPSSMTAHEKYFMSPVHFGTPMDALLLSHETLSAPNRLGDPAIAQFFDTHLETELAKLDDDVSLDARVRIQVSQSLSEGVPKISDIARRLGMSGRTLQRKLAAQGYSFQDLVDESRRQLAERLLQQTAYSLSEVAFLTGFSEQSAFTRAFKRWAGQTPRSYRIRLQSAG